MSEWTWQFVQAAARQFQLHVIAQGFGQDALPANVARHRLPRTDSRIEFARSASKAVRDLRLDLVHDMGLGWEFDIFQPHGGSYAAWLRRRLDIYPAWFRLLKRSIDNCLPRRRDFSRHGRIQIYAIKDRDSRIIALSNSVADDLVRLQQVRSDRISVIYNGVDCRRFSPDHRGDYRHAMRRQLGLNDETVLFVVAAHNFRLKGVPELLQTAKRLVTDGRPLHVAIAGGKRLKKWSAAAEQLGLAKYVTFLGPVTNMVPLYAAADAYVHPTYYDPCSLVVLEAAASGLPIVTTRRFNGAVELFQDGEEILTINDPTDHDALYECANALFDESLRMKLGTAARKVALGHTLEQNISEVLRMYGGRGHRQLAA